MCPIQQDNSENFGAKCTKKKEIVSISVSELEAGLCAHRSGAAIDVLNTTLGVWLTGAVVVALCCTWYNTLLKAVTSFIRAS